MLRASPPPRSLPLTGRAQKTTVRLPHQNEGLRLPLRGDGSALGDWASVVKSERELGLLGLSSV